MTIAELVSITTRRCGSLKDVVSPFIMWNKSKSGAMRIGCDYVGYPLIPNFSRHTRCLVNGTATQATITVVENCDLALSDSFVWFIKHNLYSVRGPSLAHRNRDRSHAMADLYTRSKARIRKHCIRWSVVPYPREIIRCNTRGE